MFDAVHFLNVLILIFLCVQLLKLVKVTELPHVWERAAKSYFCYMCSYIRMSVRF